MNERISAFLNECIAANDFPSAVYLVAENGKVVFHDAVGNAVVEPEVIPAKLETIYDLASLTKPLVTGLLAAMLVERGLLDLKGSVGSITGIGSPSMRKVIVENLLTHTSHLPAWKAFYIEVDEPNEIVYFISSLPLEPEGPAVNYSDLNFTLLMSIIERLFGDKIDSVFYKNVSRTLELSDTRFDPLTEILLTRIAASENGNQYEKKTCFEMGYFGQEHPERDPDAYFRPYQIWGEVHDGNAYFMGGVAGHAGLFSTAEEVFKIALQFLPPYTKLLKPETCELFRINFTKGMNEERSFAFQLASTKDSTAGTRMSPESFGHNGFTGTSLWIDPVNDRIFILLTNRTHCHSLPFVNINSVRRKFHDLAIEELDSRKR
ncbi:serine hydrolase domain-containing protein [Leptolyngbya sp. 7M]|uniref:serine hydrolase domain-containing protein n=1 Tax=Leptolyngbya sp. 7M TaxID=2812896 RepID=UPI001B8B3AAF|nr:serine hydrolase [Leptolyngbya sp. 7M]QYO66899.1 serine hydrolase [Leptolyngbya sp. 7M]